MAAVAAVARGDEAADLLVRGGRVVNVFTREILPANIAIKNGRIAGVGTAYTQGRETVEAEGLIVIPGLIDAHLHLESTLLSSAEFARVALGHGTTAVINDPHEIANVLGAAGIAYMLEATGGLALDFFFTVPSCVPATAMETAGGEIPPAEVERFLKHPRVVGLGEMMNYPGAVQGDRMVMEKIAAARQQGKVIDGHAPGLAGRQLQAYLSTGILTDHECTTAVEAREKIRLGMYILVRQGSAARNLAELLPLAAEGLEERLMFCSDDKEAAELLAQGHINHILRQAVALGCDPVTAVRMSTLNPARCFGLPFRGAVAPGYRADLVVVDNLERFTAQVVIKDGRVAARHGEPAAAKAAGGEQRQYANSVRLARPLRAEDFALFLPPGPVPVIGIVPGQIVTEKLFLEAGRRENGEVKADPQRDLVKIAVVERHRGSGRLAVGLLKGFGLREGAVASTVAHDSHNLLVAGVDEAAMAAAANELARLGGGFAVAGGRGEILAALPLPVAGLMSPEPAAVVAAGLEEVAAAARRLGAAPEQPFLTLSFLALPVIPSLKITDRGLVDVDNFQFI